MGKIPIGAKIGIRLANSTANAIFDHSGTADISGAAYMGAIREASTTDYAEIRKPLGHDISELNNQYEEFDNIADVYTRRIYIREDGAGSFEIFNYIEDEASTVDGHNLVYAALHYPDGITSTTASEASEYDPMDDDDSTGFGAGNMGYNILVESTVTIDGNTKYNQIEYHNCKLRLGENITPKQGTKVSIEFYDARAKVVTKAGAATKLG